jgi:hypothetical protein
MSMMLAAWAAEGGWAEMVKPRQELGTRSAEVRRWMDMSAANCSRVRSSSSTATWLSKMAGLTQCTMQGGGLPLSLIDGGRPAVSSP